MSLPQGRATSLTQPQEASLLTLVPDAGGNGLRIGDPDRGLPRLATKQMQCGKSGGVVSFSSSLPPLLPAAVFVRGRL